MSDQLSKVVPPVHAVTFVPSFSEAAVRLEAAQAAGDKDAADYWRGIVAAHEAAAKAALRIESAAAPVEVEEVADDLDALEQLESDIDGMADCTERVRSHIATLARQLAEAKAGRLTLTQDYCDMRDRAEQAESALAAVTRRVAEVEGLLREWMESRWDKPPVTDCERRTFAYFQQKEPK